jgi:hypothetical protein
MAINASIKYPVVIKADYPMDKKAKGDCMNNDNKPKPNEGGSSSDDSSSQ